VTIGCAMGACALMRGVMLASGEQAIKRNRVGKGPATGLVGEF